MAPLPRPTPASCRPARWGSTTWSATCRCRALVMPSVWQEPFGRVAAGRLQPPGVDRRAAGEVVTPEVGWVTGTDRSPRRRSTRCGDDGGGRRAAGGGLPRSAVQPEAGHHCGARRIYGRPSPGRGGGRALGHRRDRGDRLATGDRDATTLARSRVRRDTTHRRRRTAPVGGPWLTPTSARSSPRRRRMAAATFTARCPGSLEPRRRRSASPTARSSWPPCRPGSCCSRCPAPTPWARSAPRPSGAASSGPAPSCSPSSPSRTTSPTWRCSVVACWPRPSRSP